MTRLAVRPGRTHREIRGWPPRGTRGECEEGTEVGVRGDVVTRLAVRSGRTHRALRG